MKIKANGINFSRHFLIACMTVFIAFITPTTNAQPLYHPMPDSNATWREDLFGLYPGPPPTPVYVWQNVFTEGDTVINSQIYTKLYETGASGAFGPMFFFSHVYKGAYRQDTAARRVYFIPESYTTDTLLYDFNLSVGDTLPPSYNNDGSNVVLEIDSVLVNNAYHRRFLLGYFSWPVSMTLDTNYAIIEGVGSTKGFYQPIVPPFEAGSTLLCFSHDNYYYPPWTTCPFYSGLSEAESNNTLLIYPNPAHDQISVFWNRTNPAGTYEIFSLARKLLLSNSIPTGSQTHTSIDTSVLPEGVYFIRVYESKSGAVKTGRFVKL